MLPASCLVNISTLKMEAICSSQTGFFPNSVTTHKIVLFKVTAVRVLNSTRCNLIHFIDGERREEGKGMKGIKYKKK
jgi:hypothetical protein